MTKVTVASKMRENETMILDGVKQGLAKGLPLGYILTELGEELGIQTHTIKHNWYRLKLADELPIVYQTMIKSGKSNKKNETVLKSQVDAGEKPKVSAAKKIYTLVKQTNADMSHLQELYNIQGEELKLQLKRGFKKIEDNHIAFAQSVNHKLSKMRQVDQPVEVLNAPARFEVDYKSDVKVLQAPIELKYDEEKVNALIDAHEKLEDELKNEKDLRMTGEDLYDELKTEFNKLQEELVDTKKEIGLTKQVRRNLELSNAQLQDQLNASVVEIDELIKENTKLSNMNKLLNKRGLVDRLLNRDVEYNTVTN